jgi:RNA polymerase sigma-70 factor (ECF subfamily)
MQRREQFDSLINIKAFLYITIRNVSLDYLKYSKNEGTPRKDDFKVPASGVAISMDDEKMQPQVIREMQAEVDKLPAELKQVFNHVFVKGAMVPKVAEELGIEPKTVVQHKIKAVRMIQEGMLKKGMLSIPMFIYFLAIACPEGVKV